MNEEHDNNEELVASGSNRDTVGHDQHDTSANDKHGIHIEDILDDQDREAEEFAIKFLATILRLRGVRIEREQFLKSELHKRGVAKQDIDQAIADSPGAAGISPKLLDEIAKASIDFERNKSTTLSFAAGVPGGFAMLATVPGDITQFYVHVFRIMQKLAYVYGWQSFLEDAEDIDDETLGMLAGFLGVMMGIAGATGSVRYFAMHIARPAVERRIARVALTQTAWYLPMKQTLRVVGVQVTKQSFARTVTKVVPLIGGVVSGSFTYVAFNAQAKRLMLNLREIPPPNVDAADYLAAVKRAEEAQEKDSLKTSDSSSDNDGETSSNKAGQNVQATLRRTGSAIAGKFNSLRRAKDKESTSSDQSAKD